MRIKFLALILSLVFCLSSCSFNDLYVSNGSSPVESIFVSAEMKTRRGKKDKAFEIQIGFGQSWTKEVAFPTAILRFSASDFAIILPDGSRFEQKYEYEYLDFKSDKYNTYLSEDGERTFATYFESFWLVYTGEDENCAGTVSISVIAPEKNSKGLLGGGGVNIFYKLRGNNLTFTRKRPRDVPLVYA